MRDRILLGLVGFALLVAGIHIFGPSHPELRLLALLGVEVPGLDLPLSEIPNQRTASGAPQVLVYGPTHCPPAEALMADLAAHNIPFLYRDAGRGSDIDQAELGAVILAATGDINKTPPLVLVNGKVLTNPSLATVQTEYQRAQRP